ncbi:MAG: hypothetical protein R3F16_02630 [Myxococcota bacterium]|nr:hypothetical protein [Myxococcales bacterium]
MRIRQFLQLGLSLMAATVAGTAGAQTVVSSDVTTPTTWGVGGSPCPIILEGPVFVIDTKLTITPGCIVRGQPRTQAFNPATPTAGTPGTLIVSQGGFLDAQGSATNPIIFTTAAVDNNNDGVPDDDDANTFPDAWNPGDLFLDDTPATNPLAPLNTAGNQNSGLHGGLVLLGKAPTNLDDSAGVGFGKGTIEGLPVPGVAPAAATYGGYEPHDSSGILRYVSVRHAGDEIGAGNELNGITLGGVGDGTVMEFIESYSNADDGIEWFGGTVNLNNVVVAYAGDDSLDVDQGFTGNVQHAFTLATFFNQNSGAAFGTGGSGDRAGEFDGDDCAASCGIQQDQDSADFVDTSWPNTNTFFYNWTHIGNNGSADGFTNPAVSPASDNRGIQADTNWNGAILNSIVVNLGSLAGFELSSSVFDVPDAGTRRVVASTFANTTATTGLATTALADGDAAVVAGEYDGGSANVDGGSTTLLVNENHYFTPTGVVSNGRGKLQGSKVGGTLDPRPANPLAAEVSGGVAPQGWGLDSSATYRGAFPASQPLWVSGWSALSLGGLL